MGKRAQRLIAAIEETAAESPSQRNQPAVVVKTYTSPVAYQRDATLMVSNGWMIAGDHGGNPGKIRAGRTMAKGAVFLPWAFVRPSRRSASFTITWVRPAAGPAAPPGPAPTGRKRPTPPVSKVRAVGWHPDPTRRNDQRWWYGDKWSPRVRNGKVESHDPMTA